MMNRNDEEKLQGKEIEAQQKAEALEATQEPLPEADATTMSVTWPDEVEAVGPEPERPGFVRVILAVVALELALAVAVSASSRGLRFYPESVYAARQARQPAEEVLPQPMPTLQMEEEPDGLAMVPEVTMAVPGESYQKTAVLVDGKRVGVLASAQAATELLGEIRAFYVAALVQESVQGDIAATFGSEVTLVVAEADAQTVTAEELLETLTAAKTPLKVTCTVTETVRETVPYKTETQKDENLVVDTRVIESLGVQGETETIRTTVYSNGKRQSDKEDVQVLTPAQDARTRVGAQKQTNRAEPGRSEGKRGPETQLAFVSPMADGTVALNYGQSNGVLHLGLDYAPKGEDAAVLASAAGKVVCVMERGGYGLMVEIEHEGGFVTRYAHLGQADVTLGQSVAQGEKIGLAGQSGNVDSVCLHFEIRAGGEAYNPRYYIQ